MKQQVKDFVAKSRQLLRLPHNRTSWQVRQIKAKFDLPEIDRKRLELISEAAGLPEGKVGEFVREAESHSLPDRPDWDPGMMSPRDSTSLFTLVSALRPQVCVETGVGAGVSSLQTLTVLDKLNSGMLYSIDIAGPHSDEYGIVIPARLRQRWDLRIQATEPILPGLLKELGEIDLFVHDSDHTVDHMTWEYELAWRYIRPGGCLASHDVVCTTAFDDFVQRHSREIRYGGVIGNFGFVLKRGITP